MTEDTRPYRKPPRPAANASDVAIRALLTQRLAEPWPGVEALLGAPPTPASLQLHGPGFALPGSTPGVGDVVLVLVTPQQGRLQVILSGPLVRALVALLDGTAPGPLVPACPAEAGLLAGLCAAALQDRTSSLQLQDVALPGTDAPDPLPLLDAELTVALQLSLGPHSGTLHVLHDAQAAAALRRAAWCAGPGDPTTAAQPITGHLVLCSARLPRSEVASLEAGDAVVFHDPPPPPGSFRATLRLGDWEYPVAARITDEGRTLEILDEPTEARDRATPSEPSETLSLVLADVALTLADVPHLQVGAQLSLDSPIGDPVALYARGRRIASGTLVEVDHDVGVRLVERLR